MFGIGKALNSASILKGIGSIVSGNKGAVAAAAGTIGKMANAAGGGMPDFSKIGPMIQQAAYIAVLHEAIDKAEKSASFNLETQKNDLWIKLGNLAPQNLKQFELTQAIMAAPPQDQQQIFQMMSTLLKSMSDSSKSIVQNMR